MPTHAIVPTERAAVAPRAGRRRSFGSIDLLDDALRARVLELMAKAGATYDDIIDFVVVHSSPERLRDEIRTRLVQVRTDVASVKKGKDAALRAGRAQVLAWIAEQDPTAKPVLLSDSSLSRKHGQIAIDICQQQQAMHLYRAAADMAPEGGAEAVAEQFDTAMALHALHLITTLPPKKLKPHAKELDVAAKCSKNSVMRAQLRANRKAIRAQVVAELKDQFEKLATEFPDEYAAAMKLVQAAEARGT